MREEITPGRWEDLRERHADLSRLVAVMQDMHCNNVKLLWEDLRAVCRELGTVSAASSEAAAQAAATQAAGVGAAAAQAVTLWEELGTPRRTELVGMISEVRTLRCEVEMLRAEMVPAVDEVPTEEVLRMAVTSLAGLEDYDSAPSMAVPQEGEPCSFRRAVVGDIVRRIGGNRVVAKDTEGRSWILPSGAEATVVGTDGSGNFQLCGPDGSKSEMQKPMFYEYVR
jgi:hypothetical protein